MDPFKPPLFRIYSKPFDDALLGEKFPQYFKPRHNYRLLLQSLENHGTSMSLYIPYLLVAGPRYVATGH